MSIYLARLLRQVVLGGAATTYTLSGQIDDVDGNGVQNITVTLSGDASGSTTTDASGNYSFTVESGSYTLTPSYTDYAFTPSSRSATVSGANASVGDMEAGMALPLNINFESDTASQAPADWTVITGSPVVVTSMDDAQANAPVGYTKCLEGDCTGATEDRASYEFPLKLPTQFRIALLARFTPDNGNALRMFVADSGADTNESNYVLWREEDDTYHYLDIQGGSTTDWGQVAFAQERVPTRWFSFRWEINTSAETIYMAQVELNSGFGESDTKAWHAGWTTPPDFKAIHIGSFFNAANRRWYLANMWVGTPSDDWPTWTVS